MQQKLKQKGSFYVKVLENQKLFKYQNTNNFELFGLK